MRISEIIIEGDIADVANLSASNYEKGYKAMDKLFTPSQWFKKDPTSDSTSKEKTRNQSKPHLEKTSLTTAINGGKLYPEDVSALKSLRTKVINGKVRSSYDAADLAEAIKTAYRSGALDDSQKKMLIDLANQL